MDLNQKEIETIISALDSKSSQMTRESLAIIWDDPDKRRREIQQYTTLKYKFISILQKAVEEGIAEVNPPESIAVEKITRVEVFSETDGVNDFLINNKDVEVISLTPFLKNHGYKEYVLLYNKLVPKESE